MSCCSLIRQATCVLSWPFFSVGRTAAALMGALITCREAADRVVTDTIVSTCIARMLSIMRGHGLWDTSQGIESGLTRHRLHHCTCVLAAAMQQCSNALLPGKKLLQVAERYAAMHKPVVWSAEAAMALVYHLQGRVRCSCRSGGRGDKRWSIQLHWPCPTSTAAHSMQLSSAGQRMLCTNHQQCCGQSCRTMIRRLLSNKWHAVAQVVCSPMRQFSNCAASTTAA